jgi:hypothetical protein
MMMAFWMILFMTGMISSTCRKTAEPKQQRSSLFIISLRRNYLLAAPGNRSGLGDMPINGAYTRHGRTGISFSALS